MIFPEPASIIRWKNLVVALTCLGTISLLVQIQLQQSQVTGDRIIGQLRQPVKWDSLLSTTDQRRGHREEDTQVTYVNDNEETSDNQSNEISFSKLARRNFLKLLRFDSSSLKGHDGTKEKPPKIEDIEQEKTVKTGEVDHQVKEPSSPVILVPGYGGSRLEAKLDKPQAVRYFCDLKSDWSDLWINVRQLLPLMIDCLIDNFRLEYDQLTNSTRNTPGVEIRVKNADHLSSVEYLNDLSIPPFAYFAPLIERLTNKDQATTTSDSSSLIDNNLVPYKRDLNLLGAPYDFRKAPNELSQYFEDLKLKTERLFANSNRKPVTFICHSMGCNNMLYFLHRQPLSWKQQHVRRLISLAAPWTGSLVALRAASMGDNLGMPYLFSESKLVRVQRSLPSTIYLFPNHKALADVPLIKSYVSGSFLSNSSSRSFNDSFGKEKSYTPKEFKDFFHDINHPDGYRMWLDTKDLLGSLEAPQVEVWCLVGVGHKTLSRMEYSGKFPLSSSLEIYGDGDGTVGLESAQYCTRWTDQQEQPVHYKQFPASHLEFQKDPQVIDYISSIMQNEQIKEDEREKQN